MTARWAGWRCAAAMLALASGLASCAGPRLFEPPPSDQELLRRFDAGEVSFDCARCRYDSLGADWLLDQGEYDALVLGILRSGDGSGRSWYLLGRVAEATDRRGLALHYYQESLATRRNPIIALWPLYEDVNYRVRRLAAKAAPGPAGPTRASAPRPTQLERVGVESLVVATRPGAVGAFVEKLHEGDSVEVIDRSGEWEQVRLADGRVGWVFGRYTSAPGSEPSAKSPVARPGAARKTAKTVPKKGPTSAKTKVAKTRAPGPAPRATAAKAPPPDPKPAATLPAPAPKAVAVSPVAPARAPTSKALAQLVAALPTGAKSARASALDASGGAGILGCPLPRGAELSSRSPGSAGAGDHPTETYAIDAPAREIIGFYEREMERAGWRKSFAASEFLLYFEKDDRTVGVLVERKGGLFTLMGS